MALWQPRDEDEERRILNDRRFAERVTVAMFSDFEDEASMPLPDRYYEPDGRRTSYYRPPAKRRGRLRGVLLRAAAFFVIGFFVAALYVLLYFNHS